MPSSSTYVAALHRWRVCALLLHRRKQNRHFDDGDDNDEDAESTSKIELNLDKTIENIKNLHVIDEDQREHIGANVLKNEQSNLSAGNLSPKKTIALDIVL